MAQRNIDFGSFPNDPDADAIRTAFEKVQLNFTELFSGLQDQAVLSVNRTPGQGVTVNSPTGNVVVNANIACVTVTTTTLSLGLNSANGNLVTTLDNSTTQSLTIDLPSNIAGPTNANFIGTVTANAFVANNSISSSNTITATGNLSAGNISTSGGLTVTGNISSGNANLGNLATANFFAGTLTTAAQPNITTVGTLANLAVAGNSNLGNSANANFFVGNGIFLTSVVAAPSNVVINGTSQVFVTLNGNVTTRVASADIVTVSSLGANTTGYGNFTGNLSAANANLGNAVAANFFIGTFYGAANTAASATTAGTVTTAAQPNITSVGTLTGLGVNGTVTAAAFTANTGIFTGNGSGLSSIVGANVTGQVSFSATANSVAGANVSGTVSSATTATTAGTVTTASQSNITSVGTLTGLGVNGNITAANITANTGVFTGNGSGLSAIAGANVTGTVASATSATSAGSATTAGTVTTAAQPNITSLGTLSSVVVSANVTAGNVYANSGTVGASLLTGTVTTNAQPNITSVGTLTGLGVNGNITAANITANTGVFTGNAAGLTNIPGANVTGAVTSATTAGTVTTNAQPNITSVGTLSALTITGNLSSGNANLGNLARANFFQGDGSLLTNIAVGAGSFIINGNSEVRVDANSNVRISVSGNTNIVTVTGTGANIAGYANVTGNLSAGNISTGLMTGTLSVASNAQPNITSLGTLTGLNVNGVSNLGANSNVTITGGAPNSFLRTNGSGNLVWDTATLVPAQGTNTQVIFNDGGSTYAGNANLTFDKTTGVLTAHGLTVTNTGTFGNVFANLGTVRGNLLTGTLTTNAQPNVTSTGTLISLIVSGNINAGNVSGGNLVSANFFAGSGANLTNIPGANVTGTVPNATAANTLLTNTSTSTTAFPMFATSSANGYSQNFVQPGVSANLANNSITATTFVGALSGTASSATTAGTVTTNAQPNITSTGTLTGLIVSGNINAGNVYANSGTIGASLLTGTVTTNAQPNITSVGTLTSLAVTGNITAGNINSSLNITSNNLLLQGDGSDGYIRPTNSGSRLFIGANNTNYISILASGAVGSVGTITAPSFTANTGVFAGSGANLTSLNASNVSSGTLAQARLANASVTLGSTALTLGSTVTTVAGLTSVTSTTFVGALSGAATSATTAGTVTTAAQPNITSVGTLSGLTLSNASVISVGSNTNVGTFTGNFSLSTGSRLNATYADLAEKYIADSSYEPGTVLMFGGEFEVTLANAFDSTRVAGVVTTNPAYSMNSALEAEFIAEIALQGRVPCKVQGPVEKGDLMVSATDGHATANNNARAGTIIGKALEHFSGEFGIIEVAVGRF
jgi:hypothetical protein